MKKSIITIFAVMLVLVLAACNKTSTNQTAKELGNTDSKASEQKTENQTNKKDEKRDVSSNNDSGEKNEEVIISNFNKEQSYDKVPAKVMCLDLTTAETLIELGLSDKIAFARLGHFEVEELLEKNRKEAKKLNMPDEIANGIPTTENTLKLSPDLLIANAYYFNAQSFGKYEDYEKNNIKLYIPEGTYGDKINISKIYKDLESLSSIFRVREKGDELIGQFKKRVEAVKKKVTGKDKVKVCGIGGVGEQIFIAGGKGLEQDLITIAGGKNVFEDVLDQFPKVSIEQLIEKNPDIIYVHAYGDDKTGQKKIDFLKSKPELSNINAIKNNRILVYKLIAIFPGVQCFDTLESMAEEFHK